MLLFCAPRGLYYFGRSKEIVCDGNFKYKPAGCEAYQVYRIFGFIKQIHSVPLVTVLLKKKDERTYRKMWRKCELFHFFVLLIKFCILVAQALVDNGIRLRLEYAHFDNEPAVYNSFKRQFPDVQIKMCSFHVKHDLNKQVCSLLFFLIVFYRVL